MKHVAGLLPRSIGLLDFIVKFKEEHDGDSPTHQIMAKHFNTSTSVISYHLNFLVAIGKIERGEKGKSRGIRVVGAKWSPPAPAAERTVTG